MNAVTEFNQGGAVAVHGAYDPFAAYGAEAVTGDFLKFSKGEWLKGQNDEEIELGRLLAANVEELSIGWIRWEDGKPAERRMGLLGQGHKPEPRGDLGFTDPALWETDKDGKPQVDRPRVHGVASDEPCLVPVGDFFQASGDCRSSTRRRRAAEKCSFPKTADTSMSRCR